MKIRRINIGSFGVVRDLTVDNISPGFNVIFGENESGKTTIMEFIRSTIFPGRQRKNYPTYSRNDSGSIELTTNDGKISIIKRGDPPLSNSIDPLTYRNVFAMTPDDLRDSSIISSGDIKKRFLTIPGGKELPTVIESINKQMLILMKTDRRSANTVIGQAFIDLENVNTELVASTDSEQQYDELFKRRSDIEEKLEDLRAQKETLDGTITKMNLQASQHENVKKLNDLRESIFKLSHSDIITDDHKKSYDGLKFKLEVAQSRHYDAETKEKAALLKLDGNDPNKILQNSGEIKDLSNNIDRIDGMYTRRTELRNRIEKDDAITSSVNKPSGSKKRASSEILIGSALMLMGGCIALFGLISGFYPLLLGTALIPVGAYVVYRSRNSGSPIEDQSSIIRASEPSVEDMADLQRLNDSINAIERGISELSSRVGVHASNDHDLVRQLLYLLEMSVEYERCAKDMKTASDSLREHSLNLKEFLAEFGGEEKFLTLHSEKLEKERLVRQYEELKESITSSGYDPEFVSDEELPDPRSIEEQISELNRDHGRIESQMSSILNDEMIERLMDEKVRLTSEIENLSKKWGVLSLSSSIIDRACSELYSSVQPGVIQTADRYIEIMTGGRYRLNNDPRSNDVSITSNGVSKTEEQWSSGLGDQVKLAIKLAVARELSSEDLPILLDDVLLMFDHNRRKGGCAVLADISKDVQVLLFTCDREIRDLAVDAGANLICCGGS